jgi:hypothetical protein
VARHALAPVLLRGPAAIGHPWPGAANPASMPGCPLRRTSTRPLDGAYTSRSKAGGELTLGLMSGEKQKLYADLLYVDRSHALRGNAARDAPRSAVDARLESCARVTRSVTGCIPTQSVRTISGCRELLIWLWLWLLILICLPLSQRPNAGVAQGAPRQGCRGSRPRSNAGVRACRA